MHEKRATLARLVPPVAVMLAENSVVGKYQYPDLEYFSCSAAPLKVGFWYAMWLGQELMFYSRPLRQSYASGFLQLACAKVSIRTQFTKSLN